MIFLFFLQELLCFSLSVKCKAGNTVSHWEFPVTFLSVVVYDFYFYFRNSSKLPCHWHFRNPTIDTDLKSDLYLKPLHNSPCRNSVDGEVLIHCHLQYFLPFLVMSGLMAFIANDLWVLLCGLQKITIYPHMPHYSLCFVWSKYIYIYLFELLFIWTVLFLPLCVCMYVLYHVCFCLWVCACCSTYIHISWQPPGCFVLFVFFFFPFLHLDIVSNSSLCPPG